MKVAIITPIPTPYRDPFWNVVAAQPGIELHVYYCSEAKADRPWEVSWGREYRAEVLSGTNLAAWRGADASCFWNPGIVRRLREGRYDAVVVGGYNHLTMLAAMRYARWHKLPYYLMSESYLQRPRRMWRRCLKRSYVRRVVKRAAGGFPTGVLARQYLIYYGANPETLTFLPNVPDVEALAETAATLQQRQAELRQERGLPDHPVVLFVGRLIPKKNVDVLIRAFRVAFPRNDATLVIAGDGQSRSSLEELAVELQVERRVRFVGFVQPEELPELYAVADLFVLPSSETWGVVVLEALASGLPVLVTDQVGCHPDVVTDASVGEIVGVRNVEALVRALKKRLSGAVSHKTVHRAWTPVRHQMSYAVLAERFVEAVRRGNSFSLIGAADYVPGTG